MRCSMTVTLIGWSHPGKGHATVPFSTSPSSILMLIYFPRHVTQKSWHSPIGINGP